MFRTITNPYIVGNPIKTKKMFYGREDDFEFIRKKLESGSKSYIIVLSGERRSGKTSILFQILNGQLGENFIPILIDMQTMAGLKNEGEFFEKFAQETLKYIDDSFSLSKYNFHSSTDSPYKVFSKLLDDIHAAYPDKNKLVLIDEYELIETKSKEGSLSQNFVPYLSGLLESEKHISFIFTGSRTLEERGNDYWQNLFGKSLFRNVSFLSEQDTMRLITQPIEGQITFSEGVLNAIYRLTSGQPFYTQIVGQNIVDYVNETEKLNIDIEDLNRIVNEILENPLPQMIYFWNSLPQGQMLMLSLLADILDDPEKNISPAEIIKQSKKKKLGISLDSHLVNTLLEGLYHLKYVSKTDNGYSFQIDLMRQWIKRDHSIWRVMKEVDFESIIQTERSSSVTYEAESKIETIKEQKRWLIPAAILIVVMAIIAWWLFSDSGSDQPIIEQTDTAQQSSTPITENSQKETAQPGDKVEQSQNVNTGPKTEAKTTEKESSNTRTVSPSTTKKNKPTPIKITNDPADQIILIKSAMLDTKNRAMMANARDYAPQKFTLGISAEKAAENYTKKKQFKQATNKYTEAQMHYADAETQSLNAAADAKEQLDNVILQIQTLQKDLKSEHRSMNEYREAENLREKGEQYNNEEKYHLAYNSYSEAVSLYQRAVQIRITQTEKIHVTIEGYGRDMENKSVVGSKYIQDNYESTLHEEWQTFFKMVDEINIGMDIHDIEFSENKAVVLVDVLMTYSGAGGSGEKNRWKFELSESGPDWLISNITHTN
jgi:AAA+ ATPase superfamily predicted ATPase